MAWRHQPESIHAMSQSSAKGETPISAHNWGLLCLLALLWGCTFLFIGIAVKEVPPLSLVAMRVAIAALVLMIWARFSHVGLPRSWAEWRPFAVLSIANNVIPFTLFAWGQQHIASSLAGIINAATPLFVLLVARGIASEPISGNKLLGVLIGVLGVAILIGPDLTTFGFGAQTLGMLACLFAALSYGFAAFAARAVRHEPPLRIATAQLICSSVVLGCLAGVVDRPWDLPMPSTNAWAAIVALALISTALAYIIFFKIVVSAGPQNANLVTLLIPPAAIALGVVVLNERLEVQHLIGAGTIAMALIVIDGRAFRSLVGHRAAT